MIRDIIDLHAVAGTFSYADLENLARRHDPDLDLEAIRDHLAGVSVFADEDFAEYGLDEPTTADLRTWVTGWYDDLALRLVADLTDDEVPDDLMTSAHDMESAPLWTTCVVIACAMEHYAIHKRGLCRDQRACPP